MKLRLLGIIGLVLLTLNQIMISQGVDFIQTQTFDFAHWILLFGAIFTISFSLIFPKSIFNTIATILTILGIIAHIGMTTIDFVIWSYGNNYDEMNNLIFQLKNKPSIWIPFMTVGPSLFFVGLSIQAWKFIRTNPLSSIMTIVGSVMIGLSSFLANDRFFIVLAFTIFTAGLTLLIFRKDKSTRNSKPETIKPQTINHKPTTINQD